jgi:hypothetical protein
MPFLRLRSRFGRIRRLSEKASRLTDDDIALFYYGDRLYDATPYYFYNRNFVDPQDTDKIT